MTVTTCYKTTDGSTFTDKVEAEKYELTCKAWDGAMEVFGVYCEIKLSCYEDYTQLKLFIDEYTSYGV